MRRRRSDNPDANSVAEEISLEPLTNMSLSYSPFTFVNSGVGSEAR